MLRHLGDVELEIGDPEESLSPLAEATEICKRSGMEDLVVGIRALHGRALLACGRPEDADAETAAAAAELRPGIDQGYLVSHARALVLREIGDPDAADRHLQMAHDGLMEMLADLEEADRTRAIDNIPMHAAIVAQWQRQRPRVETSRIGATGAPGGRTLSEDDRVEVAWTVSTPADDRISDRIERRRHRLLRLVGEAAEQGGSPTVEDIAAALGASPATVRRDLSALRSQGHEVQTRGTRHPGTG